MGPVTETGERRTGDRRSEPIAGPPVSGWLRTRLGALVASVVLGVAVVAATPAQAVGATDIAVTTTVDEFGSGAGCSLREAVKAANDGASFGGCTVSGAAPFTVQMPTGIYSLSIIGASETQDASGDLDVRRSGTTIQGAGVSSTIVRWEPSVLESSRERVLDINPDLLPSGMRFFAQHECVGGHAAPRANRRTRSWGCSRCAASRRRGSRGGGSGS